MLNSNASGLRSRFKNKQKMVGAWITIGHPTVAEIFTRAGFDWIVVDLEHTTIDLFQAGELIRTIDLAGGAPLVRLTRNDPDLIKRVMDAGSAGIIVPMINSAEEAVSAIKATRYAPSGTRGVGLARAQGYGVDFKSHLEWQKDGPLVLGQIEHRLGVENLSSILKVDGLDGILVGPYDLSCSLGCPGNFQHPDFISALNKIYSDAQHYDIPVGFHVVEPKPEEVLEFFKKGCQFVVYSVDFRMLAEDSRRALESIHGGLL